MLSIYFQDFDRQVGFSCIKHLEKKGKIQLSWYKVTFVITTKCVEYMYAIFEITFLKVRDALPHRYWLFCCILKGIVSFKNRTLIAIVPRTLYRYCAKFSHAKPAVELLYKLSFQTHVKVNRNHLLKCTAANVYEFKRFSVTKLVPNPWLREVVISRNFIFTTFWTLFMKPIWSRNTQTCVCKC
jgi:hypothetical protein